MYVHIILYWGVLPGWLVGLELTSKHLVYIVHVYVYIDILCHQDELYYTDVIRISLEGGPGEGPDGSHISTYGKVQCVYKQCVCLV